MKVLLFLAKGVELLEASAFTDVFGWAKSIKNINIELITCAFSKKVNTAFDLIIESNILIDEINIEEYEALLIPGGFGEFGFYEEVYNQKFLDLIKKFNEKKKIISSICVGAFPLGKVGILKNKNATTYNFMNGVKKKQLKEEFGAIVLDDEIVLDENIITSSNPKTAPFVALKTLELLTNIEISEHIKKIMGY